MFTGIIETLGSVAQIEQDGSNYHFTIKSAFSSELKIDQSVSHNGVCLTITSQSDNEHTVTAIDETIQKTNLKYWKVGDVINLERAMLLGDRLDGHIVQGHVDSIAQCTNIIEKDGSTEFTFSYPNQFENLVIEKGSICINGISLTAFNCIDNSVTVAIIPYTIEHTNLKQIQVSDFVNIEYDIVGKYIIKMHKQY